MTLVSIFIVDCPLPFIVLPDHCGGSHHHSNYFFYSVHGIVLPMPILAKNDDGESSRWTFVWPLFLRTPLSRDDVCIVRADV